MTHLTDETLVLYYYAEGDGLPDARTHLDACPDCLEKLAALRQSLAHVSASTVPERDESYGRMVWARIQPQLEERSRRTWGRWLPLGLLTWPRLTLAGGMAVLLVAAFVAGRYWQTPVTPGPTAPDTPAAAALSDADARRVLLGSAGGHLERSAMMLLDVVNRPSDAATDMSADRAWAGDLVAANRLYRQTAQRQGEAALADVLEELERVLVEISNSPAQMPAEQFLALRTRIRDRGLIFKVRILESQVQERQREPGAQPVSGTRVKS